MRAFVARDLADAKVKTLSADRRFATAYNAALQAANMAIACAGSGGSQRPRPFPPKAGEVSSQFLCANHPASLS
jgi:hypothetical protein